MQKERYLESSVKAAFLTNSEILLFKLLEIGLTEKQEHLLSNTKNIKYKYYMSYRNVSREQNMIKFLSKALRQTLAFPLHGVTSTSRAFSQIEHSQNH